MKTGILFLTFFAFIACSNSSSEVIDDKEQPKPGQLGRFINSRWQQRENVRLDKALGLRPRGSRFFART